MPTKRRPAHAHDRLARPGDAANSISVLLRDRIPALLQQCPESERPRGRGRPPLVSAQRLWGAVLQAMLHGFKSQLDVWRVVISDASGDPRLAKLSDMAIYQRLARMPPSAFSHCFEQLTARFTGFLKAGRAVKSPAFATGIYALDQTVLDPVCSRLKLMRDLPKGHHDLLAGAVGCLFDLQRQLWVKVKFSENSMQNEKPAALELIQGLPQRSLLIFDLGYFSFAWLDALQERTLYFISRLPQKVTCQEIHKICTSKNARVRLCESLVYLGATKGTGACQAAYPVRLVEITRRKFPGKDSPEDETWRYVTNQLDPRELPAKELAALYGRRWDIEMALKLCKTELNLHLIWSAHANVIQHQLFATLFLAQVVQVLRFEIAEQAGVPCCEVSVELMLRWLPQYLSAGVDGIERFIRDGRHLGFIRPFRGIEYDVPRPRTKRYDLPPEWPPQRRAIYSGHKRGSPQRKQQDRLNALLASGARAA